MDTYDSHSLPPTPPSSNSSSDSEGGLSPQRSAPSSPIRQTIHCRPSSSMKSAVTSSLFSSPIPTSGILVLSEEERRTLISEGYPIPGKLPLTKQEEKNLKKIRRKIKNKISAQESRRKKKEYLETLERKCESYTHENSELKKKLDSLETNNRSLTSQLQKLQNLVGKLTRPSAATSTQTGTCLMVLVLCFAVFFGSWSPSSFMNIGYTNTTPSMSAPPVQRPSYNPIIGPDVKDPRIDAYTTPNKRSRLLLSVMEDMEELSCYEQYGPNMPFMAKTEDNAEVLYEKIPHDPAEPEILDYNYDEPVLKVYVNKETLNKTKISIEPIPKIGDSSMKVSPLPAAGGMDTTA